MARPAGSPTNTSPFATVGVAYLTSPGSPSRLESIPLFQYSTARLAGVERVQFPAVVLVPDDHPSVGRRPVAGDDRVTAVP